MTRSEEFRICSYNIHKGFSTSNRRFLLEDIRHAIRTVDSDFVMLQEVMGLDSHSDPRRCNNQFEFLADSVWDHAAYGKNAIYESGHHGNAILSKFPFVEWHNTDISRFFFSQRGILLGKTNNGIYLACTHFGLLKVERRPQLKALTALINRYVPADAPLIIGGDFNDWRLELNREIKRALQVKEAHTEVYGKPARTFPGKLPLLPMDRLYFRNLQLVDAEVLSGNPWQRLSDHCALTAIFKLPA